MKRWTERPAGGEAMEDRAASLFRLGDPGPSAVPPHFARIREAAGRSASTDRRSWIRGASWATALAATAVAAAAATQVAQRRASRAEPRPLPLPPARIVEVPPAPVPAPAPAPPVPRRAIRAAHPLAQPTLPVAEAAATAAPAPGPLEVQSGLLAEALERLRADRNPTAALSRLDELQQRFPHGDLEQEAAVARIEALLALGRSSEALATLAALDPTGPRAAELGVLRGELLARTGRCAEALPAFDRALAAAAPSSIQERALFGRGSCRATLGDLDGSRGDLERYLERFPSGRFAQGARQALGR